MTTNKIVKKVRNRLYYVKIVISFVVLCMIVVTTMSIVFSNIYKKALIDSATQEYVDSLDRLNVSIENILKQLDHLYTYMQLDKDVNHLLNMREDDMVSSYKAQNVAMQTKNINPYIHSIYLYNATSGAFISTGSPLSVQSQLDGLIKKSLSESSASIKKRLKRITLDGQNFIDGSSTNESSTQNINSTNLLSIKYEEFSLNNRLHNSIVFNINETILRKDIFGGLSGFTMLIDENGSVVVPAEYGETDHKPLIDFVFKNVILKGAQKGSLIFNEQKDPYIVIYVKSDLHNLYVVNSRPFSNITQAIKNKEVLLYIICMVILLVFIGVSFFISSRLYSPIKKVIESLKAKMPLVSDSPGGELPLITDIIEESLKKMNELTHENNESKVVMKESLLRSLIMIGSEEENEHKLIHECFLEISFKNLFLVLVKIDDYKLDKENNIKFIEAFMSTTISEVLHKEFLCETVHMYQGEICILMNFKNNKSNSFETLLTVLDEMKGFINKTIGTTITIGIGGVVNSTFECISAYKKANEMIKYRFILGTNRVIYEKYIEENFSRGLLYPTELKEKLILSIRHNHRGEYEETLNQIISLLSKYVYSDFVVILLKLVIDCIEEMNEIVARVKRIELNYDEFSSIFLVQSTLEHAKNWLFRLFFEYQIIREQINSLDDNKYFKIVEDAKKYIQNNYGDINLGVEMLAERMGYSDKYFSKVFKEVSGSNLSDYIRHVRITKAKELLSDDMLKISEIYKNIGLVNSSYFFTTFKNEVGMTPSEYKKLYLKK